MNKTIPAFLIKKKNNINMIIYTAIFALLFINLFEPFGSRHWYPGISDLKYFLFSSLIILTGMLVVVISRIILQRYSTVRELKYWQYAMFIIAEIIAMSIFYTLFGVFFPKDGIERSISTMLEQSITNTALILLLPYSISWLYFSWKEKKAIIEDIEKGRINDSKSLIAFYDEKGDLKISILLDNILYIESADNYSKIIYLNKSEISHYLLRNTLKKIEHKYGNDTPITRCHRSYLVNMDRVEILKKVKGNIFVELNTANTPDIPVSNTYYETFMRKFSQYSI